MSDNKKWKLFLLWLWSNYKENNRIYLKDVRNKKGDNGEDWMMVFWRWGLLKRDEAAGRGVYRWSAKGLNKVAYYTKEAKKKSWFDDDE